VIFQAPVPSGLPASIVVEGYGQLPLALMRRL